MSCFNALNLCRQIKIDDLIHLGEYISAYSIRDNDKEQCKEMIQKLLNSYSSLYDRYIKWQDSDKYIKEFKMT